MIIVTMHITGSDGEQLACFEVLPIGNFAAICGGGNSKAGKLIATPN